MSENNQTLPKPGQNSLAPEIEHRGSIWKHPYMLYVVLTLVLFGILLVIAWIAWNENWIPNRGTL